MIPTKPLLPAAALLVAALASAGHGSAACQTVPVSGAFTEDACALYHYAYENGCSTDSYDAPLREAGTATLPGSSLTQAVTVSQSEYDNCGIANGTGTVATVIVRGSGPAGPVQAFLTLDQVGEQAGSNHFEFLSLSLFAGAAGATQSEHYVQVDSGSYCTEWVYASNPATGSGYLVGPQPCLLAFPVVPDEAANLPQL